MTLELNLDDLLGPAEVAGLLSVKPNTVAQWRHRGLLPEPRLVLSGIPVWIERDVYEWARATGRWPHAARPDAELPQEATPVRRRPGPRTAAADTRRWWRFNGLRGGKRRRR